MHRSSWRMSWVHSLTRNILPRVQSWTIASSSRRRTCALGGYSRRYQTKRLLVPVERDIDGVLCEGGQETSMGDGYIASAKESVIVGSPFWDASTAIELKSLLEKRVKRGLHCSILGRFSDEKGRAALTELSKIGKPENCTVLSWYEEANSKVQTFHFK